MSAIEVVKKRGRPKRVNVEADAVIEETPAVKPKKPRTTRKSNMTSPIEKPDAQIIKHDEPPSLSAAQAIKESKSRSAKSVAIEKPDSSLKTVKAPSKQLEPPTILEQATAFAKAEGNEQPPQSPEPVKDDSKILPKAFKPAGPLPSIKDVQKPSNPNIPSPTPTTSGPTKSTFLADFFTEPPLAEHPAWPWPKKPATLSARPSSPSNRGPALEALERSRPEQPDTSSASPLPTTPEISLQRGQATEVASSNAEMSTSTNPVQVQAPTPTQTSKPTQPHLPSSGPRPLRIPNIAKPVPPKPSQLPYEVLKRDPKFKALSRKYTSLIVAIPVLLTSSWWLYGRYTETTVQRQRAKDGDTRTINGGV